MRGNFREGQPGQERTGEKRRRQERRGEEDRREEEKDEGRERGGKCQKLERREMKDETAETIKSSAIVSLEESNPLRVHTRRH